MDALETFVGTETTSSDYDYIYEDETCNTEAIKKFGATLTPVFFCIVVVFSLLGNVLVLVVLVKYENLSYITNHFIMNLAVSDLLFTAGLPFWAHYHMHGWTFGETTCKTVNFIFYFGFYSSSIILILMTVHRYVAVMYPLSTLNSITGLCSIMATVVIWVVSAGLASPAFVFSQVGNSTFCGYFEHEPKLWGTYQQNAFFILSFMVLIFCYSRILGRLLRPTAQKRRNKTLKLIFILMVVFFVGWGPYNIIIFLQSMSLWNQTPIDTGNFASLCENRKRLDYIFYISRLLAFSHCCINPVLYVFVGIKFKNHLKKMLKRGSQKNSGFSSRHNRLTITSLTSGDDMSMYRS
ncbi:chemokine XC receptor 1 [Cololabis saira]|uniref:chemokine XC receptor 1 n=1 Tax=Cololabis saira TaxID=129043 RepID=UPI002AD54FD3|nr:chemokine XC receptor 1 [Cololabis saira]